MTAMKIYEDEGNRGNSLEKLEKFGSHKADTLERPRSPQQILARYNQAREQYQQLMRAENDNREQRVMLYAEIKALGWCMGREEMKVVREINEPI